MEITLKHRMLLVLHNVCYNLSSSFGFLFYLFLREYFYTMHKLKTCIYTRYNHQIGIVQFLCFSLQLKLSLILFLKLNKKKLNRM